jgi:hypothetical protein
LVEFLIKHLLEEVGRAKKRVEDPLNLAWTPSPNMDGWCIEAMFLSCEFFSLSKLLYITFLANLEHSILSRGLVFN